MKAQKGQWLFVCLALVMLAVLPGCVNQLDERLNPWLGKSKDDQIKALGPPTKCAALRTGEEACEWTGAGWDNDSKINCSSDNNGGSSCSVRGGGTWEHHTIYTYRADGIASEWSYWGSAGRRTSKDSETARIESSESVLPKTAQIQPVGVRKSPLTYSFFGVPFALDKRNEIHAAIIAQAGKFKSSVAPEADEYDSSQWIRGSSKVGVMYTASGQLYGMSVWYSVKNQEAAKRLVAELREGIPSSFGLPTEHLINSEGWPIEYKWETPSIAAGVIAGGMSPDLSVALIFVIPEREVLLTKRPNGGTY